MEYALALAKMHYRRLSLIKKKGNDSFLKLVNECIDNTSVLNFERMGACSRTAHQYMLLYKAVESLTLSETYVTVDNVILNKHSILEGLMKLYRKLQRTKKCHRSVLDNQLFDVGMVKEERLSSVKDELKENLIRSVIGKMVTL